MSLLKVFCVSLGYKDVLICFQCDLGSLSVISRLFAKLCFGRMVFSLKGSVVFIEVLGLRLNVKNGSYSYILWKFYKMFCVSRLAFEVVFFVCLKISLSSA